jgi:hypothetical protein
MLNMLAIGSNCSVVHCHTAYHQSTWLQVLWEKDTRTHPSPSNQIVHQAGMFLE